MLQTKDRQIRINFEDQGHGDPALLFMPGWCASHAAFNDLIPKSAAHRRVLALDWRGHGQSETTVEDFGEAGLAEDAFSVIEASGARQVVPVALAHSGWVAIELRRRLGARIPKIVLIDWIVLDPPAPFLGALQALQDPAHWQEARDRLFASWLEGIDDPALINFVRNDMGAHDFAMWARAGREISSAYKQAGNPLKALAALNPTVPVLHVYAQPADPGFFAAQQSFAESHPWFRVQRLQARSHFPMFEAPERMAAIIEDFVKS